MLKTTFVARASDGLILCETYNTSSDNQLERLKMKAKELMERGDFQTRGMQCSTDIEDHKVQ